MAPEPGWAALVPQKGLPQQEPQLEPQLEHLAAPCVTAQHPARATGQGETVKRKSAESDELPVIPADSWEEKDLRKPPPFAVRSSST